jgi:hypothetical protein
MRFLYFLSISLLLLLSCAKRNKKTLLTPDALASQYFNINPEKDTLLKTAGGTIIRIQKGSFTGSRETFEPEVKEAITMQDIIRAGLTTQSNGNLLSSGGMIYLDSRNKNIRIAKPLQVFAPCGNGRRKLPSSTLSEGL